MQPEHIVDLARERGLDGICLTEHDRWWDAEALTALSRRVNFPVFSGVEVTVAEGHILGFGLEAVAAGATLEALHRDNDAAEGVLYLAHPARDGHLRLSEATVAACASVEAINGSDSRLVSASGAGLASQFRLPGIGGSDCHAPAEVGRAATRFERPIASQEDLVRELRAGRYTAVYVEP